MRSVSIKAFMLIAIMLIVIMLSVVAPIKQLTSSEILLGISHLTYL